MVERLNGKNSEDAERTGIHEAGAIDVEAFCKESEKESGHQSALDQPGHSESESQQMVEMRGGPVHADGDHRENDSPEDDESAGDLNISAIFGGAFRICLIASARIERIAFGRERTSF